MGFSRSGGIIARRRAEWAARLERFNASGLAVGVFAAQEGVRPATLSWWRRHLGALPRTKRAQQSTALSFVRLEPASVSPLEVLVSGHTVRVPVGFDEVTLVRVVSVLERGMT